MEVPLVPKERLATVQLNVIFLYTLVFELCCTTIDTFLLLHTYATAGNCFFANMAILWLPFCHVIDHCLFIQQTLSKHCICENFTLCNSRQMEMVILEQGMKTA